MINKVGRNYEVLEDLGILGKSSKGYENHLVYIRWFDKKPVYEFRTFSAEGEPMKRCGLTETEFQKLVKILSE